jgi:hypothetical protein
VHRAANGFAANAAGTALIQRAILLLGGYALIHLVSLALIPWPLSWKAVGLAALMSIWTVTLPLVIALGLRARAQWAWYLGIMFSGWYALRDIAVLIIMAVQSNTPDVMSLLRSAVPVAGAMVLCIALVLTLIRPELRAVLDVRLRSRVAA